MRKYLIISFFSIISQYAFSQVITGIVADEKDRKPVELASVYINGTFVGTHTDQDISIPMAYSGADKWLISG